jgi:hypothetical protein
MKLPSQYATMLIPETICWCFDLLYLYLTMKEMIEENLKLRAIEKYNELKKPMIITLIS